MPTLLGHAAAGIALGTVFEGPRRNYVLGAVCAVLPDLDVIGLHLGVPYGSAFGHRGFSHSLLAAALLGLLMASLGRRGAGPRAPLVIYLVLATALHGVLDAITSGGMGVGFLAPFDNTRFFFPWRPVRVSPLAWSRILAPGFWKVLGSELRWIVLPSAVLSALVLAAKRRLKRAASTREAEIPV